MQTKRKKVLSILLAVMMVFGLFGAMPLTALADGKVSVNPIGATYTLNAVAVPLKATFHYETVAGMILVSDSIKVQWYVSDTDSTSDRSKALGEGTITIEDTFTATTAFTPSTDALGIKYYFAVVSYDEYDRSSAANNPTTSNVSNNSQTKEVVTNSARIEVIAPESTEQDFRVKKVDEKGNLLAGAVIALTPTNSHFEPNGPAQEKTTVDGYASFTAKEGYYILSEKQAPTGYNATDEKHYISVTEEGVFIFTDKYNKYETVTFVNKEIPTLNKEDHFAFMQGYPEGTFLSERNMTRAEAVVMFSRLLTKSMNETTDHRNNYYPDVAPAAWYANQVGYMQKLGVLADYSRDGNFRPDDPVTRAEFATLAAHFDNLTLISTNSFSDVPASHWALKYINSAAAKGWITGYPDGTFKPEANITRAEVVTLVGRMLNRSADSTYLAANASSLPRSYSDLTAAHWAYLAIMEASMGHDYTMDSVGEHWTVVYP